MAPVQANLARIEDEQGEGFGSFVGGYSYQEVCDHVQALRRSVEDLVIRVAPKPAAEPANSAEDFGTTALEVLKIAKRGMAVRRRRERILGSGLFSEPAWDILLELYVARAESCDVTVGNACLAASVPMTTALRCGQMLEERAMVYRERDPKDGRRIFLRISDGTFAKLTTLFAQAEDADRSIRQRTIF